MNIPCVQLQNGPFRKKGCKIIVLYFRRQIKVSNAISVGHTVQSLTPSHKHARTHTHTQMDSNAADIFPC